MRNEPKSNFGRVCDAFRKNEPNSSLARRDRSSAKTNQKQNPCPATLFSERTQYNVEGCGPKLAAVLKKLKRSADRTGIAYLLSL